MLASVHVQTETMDATEMQRYIYATIKPVLCKSLDMQTDIDV